MNYPKQLLVLILSSLIFLCFKINLFAQNNDGDDLEISLLTCESGDALYATFGHSALRVIDKRRNRDLVFDYGNFDFDTPFFALKFLNGSLDYHLGAVYFSDFREAYERLGRGVQEQFLNLSIETKRTIYQALLSNYQPENRYYKYDFLKDNCATRIRDIIDELDVEKNDTMTSITYRNQLKTYLVNKSWLALGIDILLGLSVDKKLTTRELMFLPNSLREGLSEYKIAGDNLLGPAKVIVKHKTTDVPLLAILQPFFCLSFFFGIALFSFFKTPKLLARIATPLFIILGFGGLLLLFLWFGTRHTATQMNYNLLWLNPFYLVLVGLRKTSIKKWLLLFISFCGSLVLLFWLIIPQALNLAIIPMLLTILLINLNYFQARSSQI